MLYKHRNKFQLKCCSVCASYMKSSFHHCVKWEKFTCRYVYIWAFSPMRVAMCLNVFSSCFSVYYTVFEVLSIGEASYVEYL